MHPPRSGLKALMPMLVALDLSLAGCDTSNRSSSPPPPVPIRLTFAGVGSHGIFDAALTHEDLTGQLWMSYSAVDPSQMWPAHNVDVVTTRLASSDNDGASWTDSGLAVNTATDVTLPLAPPNNAGTWHNEVPRVLYDPNASAGARWRLIWLHYLQVNGQRLFQHGWIGYKEAATAQALVTATERKLLAALLYDPQNNVQGGATGAPVGGPPLIALQTLHPDLGACQVPTEPALLSTPTALYLALGCVEASLNQRIVLLRCPHPCDVTVSGNWTYIRTIFQNSDAAAIGFINFSAPELVESQGRRFLIVSPVSNQPFSDSYTGCLVYEFADLNAGTLVSGGTGLKQINGTAGTFNGACGYHPSHTGGVIYGQVEPTATDKFRLFASSIHIP